MSRVSVTINNRQFRIECEDGREGYLMDLAREVDNRISGLRSKSGEISDNGLMVMLAITVADELSQAGECIRRLEEELIATSDRHRAAQAAIAAALSTAAERVENVTKAIDAAEYIPAEAKSVRQRLRHCTCLEWSIGFMRKLIVDGGYFPGTKRM